MVRQVVVVSVVVSHGAILSYLGVERLPNQWGIVAGALILGASLLLVGVYVSHNDRQRSFPHAYLDRDVSEQAEEARLREPARLARKVRFPEPSSPASRSARESEIRSSA